MSIENLCLLENFSEIVGLVFLLILNATVLEQVAHAYVTEFIGFFHLVSIQKIFKKVEK